ncbi:MAG: addiction module toxin RelE [Planctomycetota bacterium]|nr:addiction module toxin RelE [Planctomycetota bacterium]
MNLLHFVETDEFCQDWSDLGLDVENDLWELQTYLMSAPDFAPIIPGTGGLRKARYVPAKWNKSKSEGIRVCYAYFPKHWTIMLIMAYRKSKQDNLTAAEKAGIKSYLALVEKYLAERDS